MAEVTLTPDPQAFPPGTAVKVYLLPKTGGQLGGQPSGTLVEEPTVTTTAPPKLVVKGLTEGSRYVGWSQRGGVDYYVTFSVETASASTGISKGEAEALIAEKAVSTASPAFTGTPTAPTAAPGANTTQVATTAYADAGDALKLAKASNLSDVANAATARASLGLGTAATLASTAFDAAGAAATAQTAAEAASTLRQSVLGLISANGTLEPDKLSPVSAEAGARAMKLPTGLGAGRWITVEKNDASANEVVLEGSIRGVAAQSVGLKLPKQTVALISDSAGSWWPIADHITQTSLKEAFRQIIYRTISVPAGQVPGNELLAGLDVKLASGEKRRILWVRYRTTSGTIKLAIARGAAGATEIAAYKALAAASAAETTTSTQELSDGDFVTVTASAGSAPKGLFVTIAEEVIVP